MSRPLIMGILNITPDSFSDGGRYLNTDDAFRRIDQLISEGADIIDIGAESSRPGALSIPLGEERQRLEPILKAYKKRFDVPLSIDTYKSEIATLALSYGADMINDISAGQQDDRLWDVVAERKAAYVLMHSQGRPETMQDNPSYENVCDEILDFFSEKLRTLRDKGIENIILDPGIGFGKTTPHNVEILSKVRRFESLDCPILVGTSRKSFIGHLSGADVKNRLAGSLVSSIMALDQGAKIIRVHDVAAHRQALHIYEAITEQRQGS